MRWTIWMTGLALAVTLAGCQGGEKEEATAEHKEEAAAEHKEEAEHSPAEADPHEGEESALLEVDAEVLRDLKITTFPAELRAGGEGIVALGELKVDEKTYAEVGAPITARVVGLAVDPGQVVRRGQTLAELQSVELGRARAERTAARARADLARKTLERKRGLAEERIVSRGELQRAEADTAAAEAELQAAEAALAALGVPGESPGGDISRFSLRSPVSGTVLERTAVQGQEADPSRPLFRIADLSHLWLVVQAPERDVAKVREGAAARISLAGLPGQSFTGKVSWIGEEVDAHTRTVPVRIVLPNGEGRLRPGMFATASLSASEEGGPPVVAVPATALQRLDDQWVVFLPREEGHFEVRPVERGRDLGGEVVVLSGLKPGELVVVEGAFLLRAEAEKKEGGAEHHHH